MIAPCPNCHMQSTLYFKSKDYNRRVTDESFDHYQCSHCSLIFISPIPEQLGDYYPDTYHFVPDSEGYLETASKHERFKIEIVQQFAKTGRLLEIGPSYGCFTYLAKQAGFDTDAIEMNSRCCQFLRDTVGINAIHSDDPIAVLQQAEPYDVIALWHVIEHLPTAWQTLAAICARVKLDGHVILATPNPEAFQFRIMRRYWPHVDAPRHVMLIPMKLLVEKMAEFGMQAELITTRDEGSIDWNAFGWGFFFRNLSTNKYIQSALYRMGRVLALCLAPLERREGKGSAYTMVFRKIT